MILFKEKEINKRKEREKKALTLIQQLPSELSQLIREYIPEIVFVFLTKKAYTENHFIVKRYIQKDQYENYIRNTIRQDNDFVFLSIMRENFEKWIFYKRYTYRMTIFSNYIYFLLEYCIENKSDNCKNIINDFLNKSGLSKNQHKKNTHKNIRWTN